MTPALYDSLDSLAQGIEEMGHLSPEYWTKMQTKIPPVPCVERMPWLLQRLTGKTILHVGADGPLHPQLLKVCARAYGIDQAEARYPDYRQMDIESEELPAYPDVEVVLLGEVLEHLVSPGVLLWQVREHYPNAEVIITVPNAFSAAGQAWMRKGWENCNKDHTAWYSYRTLLTLVEKCGYQMQEWYWHTGKPLTAEGIIFVCQRSVSHG